MKRVLEFVPLLLFFLFYKMDPKIIDISGEQISLGGIYSATYALIISTTMLYIGLFIQNKKLEKNSIITLCAVLLFGGMTLLFRNETFLKWKAPIVNWIFAAVIIFSQYLGGKPILQKMLESAVDLPEPIWKRINLSWAIFFIFLGAINLFVAFNFHKYWVDFKVFGSLACTLLFSVMQVAFIQKHMLKK
jgi:intracellular septation protein